MKTLKDIMTQQPEVISPDATIQEAAKKMDELNIGALPICENDRLVGLITDRDIVIRSVSAGQDPTNAAVRDAMTSPIHYVLEDQSIEDVARVFKAQQIRRLVVLDRSKRLIGIVSLKDLAVHAGDKDLTADVTQGISQPEKPAA